MGISSFLFLGNNKLPFFCDQWLKTYTGEGSHYLPWMLYTSSSHLKKSIAFLVMDVSLFMACSTYRFSYLVIITFLQSLSLIILCMWGWVFLNLSYPLSLILQCHNVSVWYVWKITFIQEVCQTTSLCFFLFAVVLWKRCIFSSCYWFFYPFFVSRAFVFFSSPISRELVAQVKRDSTVLPRIGALREVMFCWLKDFLLSTR